TPTFSNLFFHLLKKRSLAQLRERACNCFDALGLKGFVGFLRDDEERYFKPLKGRARCELRAVRLEQCP
ncbi:MAG: hypothetical protein QW741_04555, partial [Sulfolobales archaeon]